MVLGPSELEQLCWEAWLTARLGPAELCLEVCSEARFAVLAPCELEQLGLAAWLTACLGPAELEQLCLEARLTAVLGPELEQLCLEARLTACLGPAELELHVWGLLSWTVVLGGVLGGLVDCVCVCCAARLV